MLFNMNDYVNKVAQNPNQYYMGLAQATIDSQWDNTTQLYTISEEQYPFNNEFVEMDAWVNTVSSVITNTDKVIGSYIEIMFKDIDRHHNHRGQKYLFKEREDDTNSTYLCYDKINHLNLVSSTKAIKCNQYLRFRDEGGTIIKEPCFIGWQITSTNEQTNIDGTTENKRMILLCQYNDKTKDIGVNQRFLFNKKSAFKIEQEDNYQLEHLDEENVTMCKFFVKWTPILPTDDLVNLIPNKDITPITPQEFTVKPYIKNISQFDSITFEPNGQVGIVTCTPDWVDNTYYTLNGLTLTCKKPSNKPLILTFNDTNEDYTMSIKLDGIL